MQRATWIKAAELVLATQVQYMRARMPCMPSRHAARGPFHLRAARGRDCINSYIEDWLALDRNIFVKSNNYFVCHP